MSKLTDYAAVATLPAKDLAALRKFYEEKLGFKVAEEDEGGVAFESAGTRFYVFESMGKASGDHTQMNFDVDNVEEVVADLRERGITFETYDFPDFKSNADGIVETGYMKGAWFKDPEGNLIALGQKL